MNSLFANSTCCLRSSFRSPCARDLLEVIPDRVQAVSHAGDCRGVEREAGALVDLLLDARPRVADGVPAPAPRPTPRTRPASSLAGADDQRSLHRDVTLHEPVFTRIGRCAHGGRPGRSQPSAGPRQPSRPDPIHPRRRTHRPSKPRPAQASTPRRRSAPPGWSRAAGLGPLDHTRACGARSPTLSAITRIAQKG